MSNHQNIENKMCLIHSSNHSSVGSNWRGSRRTKNSVQAWGTTPLGVVVCKEGSRKASESSGILALTFFSLPRFRAHHRVKPRWMGWKVANYPLKSLLEGRICNLCIFLFPSLDDHYLGETAKMVLVKEEIQFRCAGWDFLLLLKNKLLFNFYYCSLVCWIYTCS